MTKINNNTKSLDGDIDKAFKLWDEGKSTHEILDMFPQHQKELKELFGLAEVIKKENPEIMPTKNLLNKILSQTNYLENIKLEQDDHVNKKADDIKAQGVELNFQEKIFSFMNKKVYILAGASVIIILVMISFFNNTKNIAFSPEEKKLAYETESLIKDINEIEQIEKEKIADTIDEDLLALSNGEAEIIFNDPDNTIITPEISIVSISTIEDIEDELNSELDGFSIDLTDLDGFESDTSLDSVEASLSNLAI